MPGNQRIPRPPGWTRADSPTWRRDLDLATLVGEPPVVPLGSFAELVADTTQHADRSRARLSAVLVALTDAIPDQPGTHVLLTRRSSHLRNHAGEVSFPGGRTDPGEGAVAAALREAREEVALDPATVTIRGELPHVRTMVSVSHIVPIVATVAEPAPLVVNPAEVDAAYWVPLTTLTAAGVHHRELWPLTTMELPMEFFDLADDTIWGATARMLVSLLSSD